MWAKEQNDEYENSQEEEIQDRAHVGGELARSTSVGYWEQLLQLAAGEEGQGAWERNRKEGKGRESKGGGGVGVVIEGGNRAKGSAMAGKEEGKQEGGGVWSVYPALSSRRPLWSWVGCEGGVRRREEEEDGEEEEEEGPRPRPTLTPQTVKWDLQQNKNEGLCSKDQIKFLIRHPLPSLSCFQFRETDWREWADGWPDEMRSGGSQTVQQEMMQVRLETDRKEGCDYYRDDFSCPVWSLSFSVIPSLKSCLTCLQQHNLFINCLWCPLGWWLRPHILGLVIKWA